MPVTIRDFNGSHPDFQGPQCVGGKGMVQDTLDKDHKPTHLPGNVCGDNQLAEWFRDAPVNKRYCRDLVLTKQAGKESTFEKIDADFFPIDDVPSNEKTYSGKDGVIHNFHFCMEMHATFQYRGGEVFDFKGDDDVWVFINNKLALDLGGVHGAQAGTVDLTRQQAQLGITTGKYYNFDFFFCERQTGESNLMITTSIDIIPPPAPGVHITDENLGIWPKGDTLMLAAGSRILKAVETKTQIETVDCSNVVTQIKNPVSGNWLIGDSLLVSGNQLLVDPAKLPPGLHKLVLVKGDTRDSLWIRIPALPIVATPVADPAGREIADTLRVKLASATPGATIHFTVDGSQPTVASPVYAGPITLTTATTLKAMAVKEGYTPSGVMVEIYGKPPARKVAKLEVRLEKGLNRALAVTRRLSDPLVVHGKTLCLNCDGPALRGLLPPVAPALLSGLGPTWRVTSAFPFHYSLVVYDHLGQYVNRMEGAVPEAWFSGIKQAEGTWDSVDVELTLLPVAHDGRGLATGAYIMKGSFRIKGDAGMMKGARGEDLLPVPLEKSLVSRFGFLRD
jgi:fibro-slime domain-containing protein